MKEQNNVGKQEVITINGRTVRITYASDGEGMEALHQLIQDTVCSSNQTGT